MTQEILQGLTLVASVAAAVYAMRAECTASRGVDCAMAAESRACRAHDSSEECARQVGAALRALPKSRSKRTKPVDAT